MLPTEDLFVYVYVLIHDLVIARKIAVPARPGPAPACSDAELLAIAVVRHLLGRRSESGFLAEVARDWGHLFPALPHQSEANRRTRWLWGAFEQFRATLAARLPEDDCQQVDTSALPVKHASRVRGPDQWTGPGNDLAARFGRDAAHAEWFYGFRLAVKTDLGSRIVRAWAIVPAAVNEREVAEDLLEAGPAPRDLLADKGFSGRAFAAAQAACGTAVLVPPDKSLGVGGVGFPRNVGPLARCGWSRAGVCGGGCAARAPAGAVTGSRVPEDERGVQPGCSRGWCRRMG